MSNWAFRQGLEVAFGFENADDFFDFGGFGLGFVKGPVDRWDAAHAQTMGELVFNGMGFANQLFDNILFFAIWHDRQQNAGIFGISGHASLEHGHKNTARKFNNFA